MVFDKWTSMLSCTFVFWPIEASRGPSGEDSEQHGVPTAAEGSGGGKDHLPSRGEGDYWQNQQRWGGEAIEGTVMAVPSWHGMVLLWFGEGFGLRRCVCVRVRWVLEGRASEKHRVSITISNKSNFWREPAYLAVSRSPLWRLCFSIFSPSGTVSEPTRLLKQISVEEMNIYTTKISQYQKMHSFPVLYCQFFIIIKVNLNTSI